MNINMNINIMNINMNINTVQHWLGNRTWSTTQYVAAVRQKLTWLCAIRRVHMCCKHAQMPATVLSSCQQLQPWHWRNFGGDSVLIVHRPTVTAAAAGQAVPVWFPADRAQEFAVLLKLPLDDECVWPAFYLPF